MSARLARLRREETGTGIVEFALVVPTLILVLVVALDFARALNAYVVIANASREGARYASVHATATEANVRDFVAAHVAPLDTDPAVLRVTLTPYVRTADVRWSTSAPAPGTVVVQVRYRWNSSAWLAGNFFAGLSGSADFDVSSSMEMVR